MYAFTLGAIAMGSLVASLFFFRFWHETRDRFFLFFGISFGLDALGRCILAIDQIPSEQAPIIYFGRLITYGLILAAIIDKNWRGNSRQRSK